MDHRPGRRSVLLALGGIALGAAEWENAARGPQSYGGVQGWIDHTT